MSKEEKRKSNKDILKEAREEGMFKEAREFTRKKKYVAASKKDNIMIYVIMVIGFLAFIFINRIFGV
ncbi:hypothetical protein CHL78_015395 [Romboutsia weinsteinii]|uniref:Uncharacterized protein n=1 Tax=Romboutsia weinsteinii TaxID=2020949 RepID=A0A371IZW6_9FIRM|nr:hypothetical protein [Romboutsia weinsteinii]RDY26015.1 hypothetical protein CHL78_015395 [Romboutsia weinsteinii]